MPYICLARTDIPDGQVQILDLKPNTSQRSLIYEPPGQTKYINRALNGAVVGDATTGVTTRDANGLRAYLADRMDPTNLGGNVWTPAQLTTAADALLAEVDAGNALTAADVNAALLAALGAAVGFGIGGSVTALVGVPELLSVLAGRGYFLLAGFVKLIGAGWDATQRGDFTTDRLIFGTTWQDGEIVPSDLAARQAGGDLVPYETKPIRHTYDGTHFQVSLATGHLATFAAGVTLFPDSDLLHHIETTYKGPQTHPQVDNARVVTVYDDDGTLLA